MNLQVGLGCKAAGCSGVLGRAQFPVREFKVALGLGGLYPCNEALNLLFGMRSAEVAADVSSNATINYKHCHMINYKHAAVVGLFVFPPGSGC